MAVKRILFSPWLLMFFFNLFPCSLPETPVPFFNIARDFFTLTAYCSIQYLLLYFDSMLYNYGKKSKDKEILL